MATVAWEIAEFLASDDANSAIVASTAGRDAVRLLTNCAAGALRRIIGAPQSGKAVGALVKPEDEKLKRVAKRFKDWSAVIARSAIQSNCV